MSLVFVNAIMTDFAIPETKTSIMATKKRVRSAQVNDDAIEPPKKRGRPSKVAAPVEESEEEQVIEQPKKRGRPAKAAAPMKESDEEQAVEQPKKRGRPARANAATTPSIAEKPGRPVKAAVAASSPPKKRGRTAKTDPEPADEEYDAQEEEVTAEPPKKRGRPSKGQVAPATAKQTTTAQPAKKRGRPSKAVSDPAEAPADPDTPAPRKRHSGRTGGPTTKISTDAVDAADQLEEELIDVAEKSTNKGGRSKASKTSATKEEADNNGKNYWLMKAEQVDRMETLKDGTEFNTKFTIDDLRSKSVPEPWEGVRNMVARNNMRAMKQGDLAFFYASQGKAPGITGIVEIVQEHEPDYTIDDESSIGYVEPAKRGKENQWSLVHVEFRKKLSKPATLKELQKYSTNGGILQDMQVIKQSRLSVAKVSEKEWNFIVDNIIEGYEEEDIDELNGIDGNDDDGLAGVEYGGDSPTNANLNDGQAVANASIDESEGQLPDLPTGPEIDSSPAAADAYMDAPEDQLPDLPVVPETNGVLPTADAHMDEVEVQLPDLPTISMTRGNDGSDGMLTSGTALPPSTHATSRPTSRQGSRPASRAGSRMAVSRQGSLAPPALQVTMASAEITKTETVFQESVIPESTGSFVTEAAKQGIPSRASSRAPCRPSSRAPSLQPSVHGNSLESSARPVSRGRSKTSNMGPLIESPIDA
jgi:predicted RNA-binding protein with PUA-like domain